MDEDKIKKDFRQELKRGNIILIVLLVLREKDYGYNVLLKVNKLGVSLTAQTLYPLLNRLQEKELLDISWVICGDKERKYYVTSESGLKVCREMLKEWEHLNEIMMLLNVDGIREEE